MVDTNRFPAMELVCCSNAFAIYRWATFPQIAKPIVFPFSALADLPPVVAMPGFPGANEPCRKHAFAITLGYLTT